MNLRLLALLDRPNEKSFGMVPILIRDDRTNGHSVHGLNSGIFPLILPPTMTVEDFIQNNCRNVASSDVTFVEPPTGKCAGWMGTAFLDACTALDAADPIVPDQNFVHVDGQDKRFPGGAFWIDDIPVAYARLDSWLTRTAKVACQRKSHEMSALMHWCLPDRIETHAAMWYTAPDEAHADREIEWLMRMWYRRREPTLTKDGLLQRLKDAVSSILA